MGVALPALVTNGSDRALSIEPQPESKRISTTHTHTYTHTYMHTHKFVADMSNSPLQLTPKVEWCSCVVVFCSIATVDHPT